jgi:hypothetical protein
MHASDYFHNVIAPAVLQHQKAFHVGALRYHFTSGPLPPSTPKE